MYGSAPPGPVQGLSGNVYRSDREKQGIVVYRQRVLQTVTSPGVVSLVFRRHDLLKIAKFNPQQEARFSLWKKWRKWSLAPRSPLKSAWPNVRIEGHLGEKNNATMGGFSPFLKINNSREQSSFTVNSFLPSIYG